MKRVFRLLLVANVFAASLWATDIRVYASAYSTTAPDWYGTPPLLPLREERGNWMTMVSLFSVFR